MEKRISKIGFAKFILVFSALFLPTISPTTVSDADNESPPVPKVITIEADFTEELEKVEA